MTPEVLAAPQQIADSLVNQVFPVQGGPTLIALSIGPGQYFGTDFRIVGNPPSWKPTHGRYNNMQGYWIYRPDRNLCWQAQNADGPFAYWNLDGNAQGLPQDWELFLFESAPGNEAGSVLIKNVHGAYVNFDAAAQVFRCTAPRDQGSIFEITGQ